MGRIVKYTLWTLGASGCGFYFGYKLGASLEPIKVTKYVKVSQPVEVDLRKVSLYTTVRVLFSHIVEIKSIPSTQLREMGNFVINYDKSKRIPQYVVERITRGSLQKCRYFDRLYRLRTSEDADVHKLFRSTNADYESSGYSRGHIAPAANHVSLAYDYLNTFYLTNMAPQHFQINSGIWNLLETHVRTLTTEHRNVYVCSGPLFKPSDYSNNSKFVYYEVIGENQVAVPTHFFKYIRAETLDGKYNIESYIIPNIQRNLDINLEHFQVNPDEIEKTAGFLFMEDEYMHNNILTINGISQNSLVPHRYLTY